MSAPDPEALVSAVRRTKRVVTAAIPTSFTPVVLAQVPMDVVVKWMPSELTLTLNWPMAPSGDAPCRGS